MTPRQRMFSLRHVDYLARTDRKIAWAIGLALHERQPAAYLCREQWQAEATSLLLMQLWLRSEIGSLEPVWGPDILPEGWVNPLGGSLRVIVLGR